MVFLKIKYEPLLKNNPPMFSDITQYGSKETVICNSPLSFSALLRSSPAASRQQPSPAYIKHHPVPLCPLGQGSPNSGILVPGDLRWSWCNLNRNKMPSKCNVLESSPNHLPLPPWFVEKLFSMNWSPMPPRLGTASLAYFVFFFFFLLSTLHFIHAFVNCPISSTRLEDPWKQGCCSYYFPVESTTPKMLLVL